MWLQYADQFVAWVARMWKGEESEGNGRKEDRQVSLGELQ